MNAVQVLRDAIGELQRHHGTSENDACPRYPEGGPTMAIVEVPADTPPETIRLVSSCMNPLWAHQNPNLAMQAHMECEVGVCVTKTVAYRALVEQGRLVPDSSRT